MGIHNGGQTHDNMSILVVMAKDETSDLYQQDKVSAKNLLWEIARATLSAA